MIYPFSCLRLNYAYQFDLYHCMQTNAGKIQAITTFTGMCVSAVVMRRAALSDMKLLFL